MPSGNGKYCGWGLGPKAGFPGAGKMEILDKFTDGIASWVMIFEGVKPFLLPLFVGGSFIALKFWCDIECVTSKFKFTLRF